MLRARFAQRIQKIDRLIERELARTKSDSTFGPIVRWYAEHQRGLWDTWNSIQGDVVGALAAWESLGRLELWTCGATHGFFPALLRHRGGVQAQVELAVDSHLRATGKTPRGMWLPECGYAPGVDAALTKHGIAYTALESHAIVNASPRPRYGTATPIITPEGLVCFGRDASASHQVWAAEVGYPGDALYREFYRDVGFDNPHEDVREFVAADGTRQNTGLRNFIASPSAAAASSPTTRGKRWSARSSTRSISPTRAKRKCDDSPRAWTPRPSCWLPTTQSSSATGGSRVHDGSKTCFARSSLFVTTSLRSRWVAASRSTPCTTSASPK